MTTFAELDALSTTELHDRALRRAEKHFDLPFFWSLLGETPASEAAAGDVTTGQEEVAHWSRRLLDMMRHNDKALESQRPIYIDYLLKHSE